MTKLIDSAINAEKIDLTNCGLEPIHVPGAVQPHGLLLAFDEDDDVILQASLNCEEFLGIETDAVLGSRLSAVLGTHQAEFVKQTLSGGNLRATNPSKLRVGEKGKERLVNGILHRYKGSAFLELEPLGEAPDSAVRTYQMLQHALLRIQEASSPRELWAVVAEDVKAILGYDRVLVYKFDRANNGEVIEERVSSGFELYKGLHYPASDIPQQARRLYTVNGIRHIPDATYTPVSLVPLIFPATKELTDLSHAVLRSVSPIHLEYLRNMGVKASISISLIRDSSLWGLIACHNYSPRFVPYEMRAACELLGQVVSSRIELLENELKTETKTRTNIFQSRFLGALAESKDLKNALIDNTPNIQDYMSCGGAAICRKNDCLTMGKTPSPEQIAQLTRKLKRLTSPVFVSDALSTVFSEAAAYKDVASGLMALTLNRDQNTYVLWFRPEQAQTVSWAGDPKKPVSSSGGSRLSPRKSFELWKEKVEGKAAPWTEAEIEAALELRSTITCLLPRG
ncbi:MAG TPA: GAF domain-containing protein [Candidatus Angelobacter sp.]|nr:GAF domain-containing protein [Candidatus Angelobacter sp.]